MEPLGDYLKDSREKKRLSIDKIVEDTHILKKYVLAIEADDFTEFPGEAYLKGFLRNYSEYLELDSTDVIRRYEKIKLSETPSPIEQLIPKPGFDYSRLVFGFIIFVAVSLLGASSYFIYETIRGNASETKIIMEKKEKPVKTVDENKIYITESDIQLTLKKDEKINAIINDVPYSIWLSNLDPNVTIISSEGKEQFLIGNGYTNKFDVNGDGQDDLEIMLVFWDSKTAKISARQAVSRLVNESSIDNKFFVDDTVEVLYQGDEKIPLSCYLTFNNDSYIRYISDDLSEVEAKKSNGNSITVDANNQILFMASNAGAVNFSFSKINKKIILGEPGELAVKLISWVRKDNQYALQISSLK